jgi:ABC-type antimicrobial peptide transport system permease subunit
VTVIDSTIARDLYPDEDPMGQYLRLLGQSWQIVGIVAPIRHTTLDADPQPRVYVAQIHNPMSTSMIVRTAIPPLTLVEAIRKTILAADPDQPLYNIRTLEQAIHETLAKKRTTLFLLGSFAVVAVSLACIGIYGVVSYAIAQRTRELSIRSALGAQRRDIMALVFKGGMWPSLIGMAIGLVAAFALTRVLESQLFEVKTHDPLVFVASVCLLGIVATLAICFPAWRAARVDPMEALRCE